VIKSATEWVIDAIADMNLDFTPVTIADVVYHGISIDTSVVDHLINTKCYPKEYVNFLTSRCPIIEVSEIHTVISWLNSIECDGVFGDGRPWLGPNEMQMIGKLNIPYFVTNPTTINSCRRPIVIVPKMLEKHTTEINKPYKVIRCVNSKPVNLTNETMQINN
jgi:hypothetical protein